MTARTDNQLLQPEDVLDISELDATHHRVHTGDRARLTSRHGSAELAVQISERVRPGQLFTTFHTASTFINRLIGDQRDPITHTPEYKVTAVRLERV
jgi:formate dehydrogenase major subunit